MKFIYQHASNYITKKLTAPHIFENGAISFFPNTLRNKKNVRIFTKLITSFWTYMIGQSKEQINCLIVLRAIEMQNLIRLAEIATFKFKIFNIKIFKNIIKLISHQHTLNGIISNSVAPLLFEIFTISLFPNNLKQACCTPGVTNEKASFKCMKKYEKFLATQCVSILWRRGIFNNELYLCFFLLLPALSNTSLFWLQPIFNIP